MRFAIVFVLIVAAAYGLTRLVERIPADCDAVGAQLASYELGNYAEPEERAPAIERGRARCEAAHVNRDEGECLDKATSRARAVKCVPRLFPDDIAGCDDYACMVEAFGKFTDRMCRCTTKPCAEKVNEDYTRYMTELGKTMTMTSEDARPMDAQMTQQLTDHGKRYAECMTKIYTQQP